MDALLHAGDLAKKKIYPALFALYVEGHLPGDFSVFGYARSKMSDEEFRKYIRCSCAQTVDPAHIQPHLHGSLHRWLGCAHRICICICLYHMSRQVGGCPQRQLVCT